MSCTRFCTSAASFVTPSVLVKMGERSTLLSSVPPLELT